MNQSDFSIKTLFYKKREALEQGAPLNANTQYLSNYNAYTLDI